MKDRKIKVKKFTVPLEGSITLIGVDLLDAMKSVDEKLAMTPKNLNLRPKMGQVEVKPFYEEEE
jgi:hypothetical protein